VKPITHMVGDSFLYSCAFDKTYTYEKFVPEHILAVLLTTDRLQQFALDNDISCEKRYQGSKNILLDPNNMLKGYFLNFHYNAPIEQFAKLSGRSLTSFKREFSDIFKTSPGTWLKDKRLSEAYYQVKPIPQPENNLYFEGVRLDI